MPRINPSKQRKLDALELPERVYRSTLLNDHPEVKTLMQEWRSEALLQKETLLPLEFDFIMGMADQCLNENEEPWQGETNQVGKLLRQIKSLDIEAVSNIGPLPKLKLVPMRWIQPFFLEQLLTTMLDEIKPTTDFFKLAHLLQKLAEYEYLPSCLKENQGPTETLDQSSMLTHLLDKLQKAYRYTKWVDKDDYATGTTQDLNSSLLGLLRLRLIQMKFALIDIEIGHFHTPISQQNMDCLRHHINPIIHQFNNPNSPHLQKISGTTRSRLLIITAQLLVYPLNQKGFDRDSLMCLLWKQDINEPEIIWQLFLTDKMFRQKISSQGTPFNPLPIFNLISLCAQGEASTRPKDLTVFVTATSPAPQIKIPESYFALFEQQFPEFTKVLQENLQYIKVLDAYYARLTLVQQEQHKKMYDQLKEILTQLAIEWKPKELRMILPEEKKLEISPPVSTTAEITEAPSLPISNQVSTLQDMEEPALPQKSASEGVLQALSMFSKPTPTIELKEHESLDFHLYLPQLYKEIESCPHGFLDITNPNLSINANKIIMGLKNFLNKPHISSIRVAGEYNIHKIIYMLTGVPQADVFHTLLALPLGLATPEKKLQMIMCFFYAHLNYSDHKNELLRNSFQNLIKIYEQEDKNSSQLFAFIREGKGTLRDEPFKAMLKGIELWYVRKLAPYRSSSVPKQNLGLVAPFQMLSPYGFPFSSPTGQFNRPMPTPPAAHTKRQ